MQGRAMWTLEDELLVDAHDQVLEWAGTTLGV